MTTLSEVLSEGPSNGYSPTSSADGAGPLTLKLSATTSGELRLNDTTVKRVTEQIPADSKCWLEPGDLLIQRANTLDYVGAAAIYEGPSARYIYPDLMMRVRIPAHDLRHYVWRYLNSPIAKEYFRSKATGTSGNMPKINGETVRSLPLPLPPVNEQRRIIARLEDLLARSRRAKEALDAIPMLSERFRQAMLAAAFRGDLTRDWRERNPDVESASRLLERIRSERRRRWQEAGLERMRARGSAPKEDGQTKRYKNLEEADSGELPTLPESWCWATVGDILCAPLCNGLSVSGSDSPPGVSALKLSSMGGEDLDYDQRRYLPLPWEDVKDLEILPGDFFIARGNGSLALVGRGTPAISPPRGVIFPDTMIRLRFEAEVRSTNWLPLVWAAPAVRRQVEQRVKTTAGIWKIAQPQVESIVVPLPPLEEQREAVRLASIALRSGARLTGVMAETRERILQLERSILERAFRGELVPQNPGDEPASVLLERIRAERERPEKANSKSPPKRRRGTEIA